MFDRDDDDQDKTNLYPSPVNNSSSCSQSMSLEQQCPMQEVDTSAYHDDCSIHDESWLPENRILGLVLDILQRRDAYEIFAEPVDPSEVENYYEIIKEPMDFGTMRAKLHEGMYKNLQHFEHDIFLIFDNAMHFNSPTTVYFRQARALEDLAKKVFQVLRTGPENLELEFAETKRRSCRKVNEHRGSRRERKRYISEVDKRCSYKPRMLLLHEIDSSIAPIHDGPQLLMDGNHDNIGYKESLMLFAKDLGETAQKVVRHKMQGMWKREGSSVDTDKFWDHNTSTSIVRVKCQNSSDHSFLKREAKQTFGSNIGADEVMNGKGVKIRKEVDNPRTRLISIGRAPDLNQVRGFSCELKRSSANSSRDVSMMGIASRREIGNDLKKRPPE